MNCPGSGEPVSVITDNGLAFVRDNPMSKSQPALDTKHTDHIVRYPKGMCSVCHAGYSTDTHGNIRNHPPRSAA